MPERRIENAIIQRTMLGWKDAPSMMVELALKGSWGGQSFGLHRLGGHHTDWWIRGLLKALGVECWEDIKGTHCRADHTDSRIFRLGHIIEDLWFDTDNPAEWKEVIPVRPPLGQRPAFPGEVGWKAE